MAQSQMNTSVDKKKQRVKRDVSPIHSQMLGSDVDDFEFDDDETCMATTKYCIYKEEYPPELLRAFDIVWNSLKHVNGK